MILRGFRSLSILLFLLIAATLLWTQSALAEDFFHANRAIISETERLSLSPGGQVARIAELESQIKELRTELAELEALQKGDFDSQQALEAQLATLERKIESESEAHGPDSFDVERLQEQKEALEAKQEELESAVSDNSDRYDELTDRSEELLEEINDLREEISSEAVHYLEAIPQLRELQSRMEQLHAQRAWSELNSTTTEFYRLIPTAELQTSWIKLKIANWERLANSAHLFSDELQHGFYEFILENSKISESYAAELNRRLKPARRLAWLSRGIFWGVTAFGTAAEYVLFPSVVPLGSSLIAGTALAAIPAAKLVFGRNQIGEIREKASKVSEAGSHDLMTELMRSKANRTRLRKIAQKINYTLPETALRPTSTCGAIILGNASSIEIRIGGE